MNSNGFKGHSTPITPGFCKMQLAVGVYDPDCERCCGIRKVINLRRRTVENGASEQEEEQAQKLSDVLVAKYGLTRGEVYDRLYAPRATPPPTMQEFKEDIVWAVRKTRSRSGRKANDIQDIG